MSIVQEMKIIAYNAAKAAQRGDIAEILMNLKKDKERLKQKLPEAYHRAFESYAYDVWLIYDNWFTVHNEQCKEQIKRVDKRIQEVLQKWHGA